MNSLKKIISPNTLIVLLFIFIHIILLNINSAEWGDSYRILRASEFIRNDFTYPTNEKRPPMFSILLSIRPSSVDPILWGRLFMLGLSSAFLFLYLKFLKILKLNSFTKNLSILFLLFNPVFLYWSIRIYADTLFAFFALLNFYLFYKYKNKLSWLNVILLALISAISVLTRFEGYLLFGSIGFGILTLNYDKIKKFGSSSLFKLIKDNFINSTIYTLSFILFLVPLFLYRNPLNSSYFEEPSGRSYDLSMVITYVVSLLFMFGFTPAFSFFIFRCKKVFNIIFKHLALSLFIFTELFLILLWPAAIPRLFVPIIPFLILLIAYFINNFINNVLSFKSNLYLVSLNIALLFIYIFSQYFLKLQFLINNKLLFISLIVLQILGIIFLTMKKSYLYISICLVSAAFWSFSIIYLHKDNFFSVKNAAEYVSNNISGVVAYNDVSSVSDWYLNNSPSKNNNLSGFYYNFEKDELLTKESLVQKNIDYLIITNEHNKNLDIDLDKRPHLQLLNEFNHKISDTIFNTRVVKILK